MKIKKYMENFDQTQGLTQESRLLLPLEHVIERLVQRNQGRASPEVSPDLKVIRLVN